MEAQGRAQPGAVVGEHDLGAVHPRHRRDQRQAEPGAGAAAARVEPDEAAERARAVGFRDAGAAVGDDERRAPGVAAAATAIVRAGGRMAAARCRRGSTARAPAAGRGRSTRRPGVGGAGDGERRAPRRPPRRARRRRRRAGRGRRGELLGADARPRSGRCRGAPSRWRARSRPRAAPARCGPGGSAGSVSSAAASRCADQPAERAAQVVGEAVGDHAQVAHQRLDPVEHGVERAREPVELVAGAAQRHAAVEGAAHDRPRGAVDLGDPAGDQPRQQPAGGEREQRRSPPAPRAAPGRACGRRRRARPRRARRAAARRRAGAAPAPRSRSACRRSVR